MNESQTKLLADCLEFQSSRCTAEMRELLEVLARDAQRYNTVRSMLVHAFGKGWSADEYDARIDAKS